MFHFIEITRYAEEMDIVAKGFGSSLKDFTDFHVRIHIKLACESWIRCSLLVSSVWSYTFC